MAYVKWDSNERERILIEARRLLRENPRLSKTELIQKAQIILAEDRRRVISSIATPAFDWFHTGLFVAAEPKAEPEPIEDETLKRILDIVLGIDRKFETKRFEERLTELEKQVRRIHRILNGGFALVPAESLVKPTEEVQGQSQPSAPKEGTRKPNVVVLSIPSGNTQGGIKKGTAGYVGKLDFWDTPRRQVDFGAYDYVVPTKYTPAEWITTARTYIPNGKLQVSYGGAEQIARFIRTLPEVKNV